MAFRVFDTPQFKYIKAYYKNCSTSVSHGTRVVCNVRLLIGQSNRGVNSYRLDSIFYWQSLNKLVDLIFLVGSSCSLFHFLFLFFTSTAKYYTALCGTKSQLRKLCSGPGIPRWNIFYLFLSLFVNTDK